MRIKLILVLSVSLFVLSLLSCGKSLPDSSSPEAFIRDFISALKSNQTERFALFYPQEEDLNTEAPGYDLVKGRFSGIVREEFLSRCSSAAEFLQGKDFKISEIKLRNPKPRASQFFANVSETYSMIDVTLSWKDQTANMRIDEIFCANDKWYIINFFMIIEFESEDKGTITIR